MCTVVSLVTDPMFLSRLAPVASLLCIRFESPSYPLRGFLHGTFACMFCCHVPVARVIPGSSPAPEPDTPRVIHICTLLGRAAPWIVPSPSSAHRLQRSSGPLAGRAPSVAPFLTDAPGVPGAPHPMGGRLLLPRVCNTSDSRRCGAIPRRRRRGRSTALSSCGGKKRRNVHPVNAGAGSHYTLHFLQHVPAGKTGEARRGPFTPQSAFPDRAGIPLSMHAFFVPRPTTRCCMPGLNIGDRLGLEYQTLRIAERSHIPECFAPFPPDESKAVLLTEDPRQNLEDENLSRILQLRT